MYNNNNTLIKTKPLCDFLSAAAISNIVFPIVHRSKPPYDAEFCLDSLAGTASD